MEMLSNFCEKLTKNQQNNRRILVILTLISIISMIYGIVLMVMASNNAILMLSVAILCLSITFIWTVLMQIRYYKDIVYKSDEYIKKLEDENKDYKMNTDVLLNDPEIKRIMQGRMARMPKD